MSIKKIEDPELEAMDYDMDMKEDYEHGENKCCHEEDQYYQVRVSRCKEECPKPKPCPPEPCYKPCYVPCYEKFPEPCHKDECHKKERKGTEVLINAATGGAMLPLITTPFTTPIQVVSLTLDPDCIDDLSVLLNYTSIISVAAAVAMNLTFQVYRAIDDGPPVAIGSSFTFVRTVTAIATYDFGFQVFDKRIEGRTVTYSVVVTSGQLSAATPIVASIMNATLSAVGVER